MSEPRKCPLVELSAYLDGALAPARAKAIEAHVVDCPACQARVREERNLRKAVLVLACPSAETLGSFIDGSLAGGALRTVQAHVEKCGSCSDVADWTKEAKLLLDSGDIDKIVPLPRKRRGRVAAQRRRNQQIISLALPIAAAASLFLAFLIFSSQPSSTPQPDVAQNQPRPKPQVPPVAPPAPPKPQPAQPPVVRPQPQPEVPTPPEEPPAPPSLPVPGPDVEKPPEPPAPPVAPNVPPVEQPREVERPKPDATPTPAPTPVTLASLAGDVRIGPSRDKATKASGTVTVGPRDLIIAGTGARLSSGESFVLLGPSSEVRFAYATPGTVRLDLEKGEAYAEVAKDLDLACHGAVARGDSGAKLLLRSAPKGAQLFVCEGSARFTTAAGEVALTAGQASEVEGDAAPTKPHVADLARTSPWLPDAQMDKRLATGLEYPRGFLAVDSLAVARATLTGPGSLRERARALYAIEAVRASDERLARLASSAAKDADLAFDAIVRDAAGDALAAPPAALAVLARARRTAPARPDKAAQAAAEKELAKTLLPLGRALEKATPADLATLAQDVEALLPLRALEKAGAKLKTLRERALAVRPADERGEAEAAARTLLASGRESEDLVKRTDEILAKKPEDEPTRLHPAVVLAADRSVAVAGNPRDDERRYLRGLAHLEGRGGRWGADTDAVSILLFLARDAHAIAGRAPVAPPQGSIVVTKRDEKTYEVTFTFDTPKRPKTVLLGGSWDEWKTDKEPMQKRTHGSFVETIVLPRGRYLYKFRLDGGRVWDVDPRNPLSQGDAVGGLNSVLVLE